MNDTLLLNAKQQYTERLVKKLTEPITDFIDELSCKCKEEAYEGNEEDDTLVYIQNELEEIAKYDEKKVKSVSANIKARTECEYLEELLQSVFILHTKVLNSALTKNKEAKPEVVIPSIETFIYKCLKNSSRVIWKQVYIFEDIANDCETQKNKNQLEITVDKCIRETVTELLPIDKLVMLNVKEYYNDSSSDSESDSEDEKEVPKKKGKKKFFPKKRFGGYADSDDEDDDDDMIPSPVSEPVPAPMPSPMPTPMPAPPAVQVAPAQPQLKTVDIDPSSTNMLDSVNASEMPGQQSRVQFDESLNPPNVNV